MLGMAWAWCAPCCWAAAARPPRPRPRPRTARPGGISATIEQAHDIAIHALGLVGTPYRWCVTPDAGFDCSGLIGYVYRHWWAQRHRTRGAAQRLGPAPIANGVAQRRPGGVAAPAHTHPCRIMRGEGCLHGTLVGGNRAARSFAVAPLGAAERVACRLQRPEDNALAGRLPGVFCFGQRQRLAVWPAKVRRCSARQSLPP